MIVRLVSSLGAMFTVSPSAGARCIVLLKAFVQLAGVLQLPVPSVQLTVVGTAVATVTGSDIRAAIRTTRTGKTKQANIDAT